MLPTVRVSPLMTWPRMPNSSSSLPPGQPRWSRPGAERRNPPRPGRCGPRPGPWRRRRPSPAAPVAQPHHVHREDQPPRLDGAAAVGRGHRHILSQLKVEKHAVGRSALGGRIDQGQFDRVPAAVGPVEERGLREVAKDGSGRLAAVVRDLAGPVGGDHQDELVPPQPGVASGSNGRQSPSPWHTRCNPN